MQYILVQINLDTQSLNLNQSDIGNCHDCFCDFQNFLENNLNSLILSFLSTF